MCDKTPAIAAFPKAAAPCRGIGVTVCRVPALGPSAKGLFVTFAHPGARYLMESRLSPAGRRAAAALALVSAVSACSRGLATSRRSR